mmetsp:Transcript_49943/g.139879  ORF Transcript_49943/g.139879 Transcript_49943/m.139879 type:complete len:278 (-) Transcript_49943:2549-3382(-)
MAKPPTQLEQPELIRSLKYQPTPLIFGKGLSPKTAHKLVYVRFRVSVAAEEEPVEDSSSEELVHEESPPALGPSPQLLAPKREHGAEPVPQPPRPCPRLRLGTAGAPPTLLFAAPRPPPAWTDQELRPVTTLLGLRRAPLPTLEALPPMLGADAVPPRPRPRFSWCLGSSTWSPDAEDFCFPARSRAQASARSHSSCCTSRRSLASSKLCECIWDSNWSERFCKSTSEPCEAAVACDRRAWRRSCSCSASPSCKRSRRSWTAAFWRRSKASVLSRRR